MKLNDKTIIFLIISALIIPSIVTGANCVILGRGSGLSSLIAKLFTWSLRIGGLVVFGALVYGGFIYLISAGNESRIKTAKSYMTGAILGMVILLGSFLLLNTINPQLLRNTMEPGMPNQGICLFGKNKNGSSTRCCFNSSQTALPDGFKPEQLQFQSIRDVIEGVFWFDSEGWKGDCTYEGNTKTDPNASSSYKIKVSGLKSFYLEQNKPGVYLYKNPPKPGFDPSQPFDKCPMTEDTFPEKPYQQHLSKSSDLKTYKNGVSAMVFKSAGKCEEEGGIRVPKIAYGAIVHGKTNYKGKCVVTGIKPQNPAAGTPFGGFGGGTKSFCINRTVDLSDGYYNNFGPNEAESITPFELRLGEVKKGKITFYEEIGYEGDRFTINADDIDSKLNNYWKEQIDYPIEDGDLGGVNVIPGPDSVMRGDMEGELNRILSVKIGGDFLVLLGKDSTDGITFEDRCEITKNSVPNLKGHYVLNWPEDDKVNALGIVPLKQSEQ